MTRRRTAVTITDQVDTPRVPNYLRLAVSDTMRLVGDFTDDQLILVGETWTQALLEAAGRQRAAAPAPRTTTPAERSTANPTGLPPGRLGRCPGTNTGEHLFHGPTTNGDGLARWCCQVCGTRVHQRNS